MLPEPEAIRLSIVFEEQAREQYRQQREQQRVSRGNDEGYTESGFETDFSLGEEDDQDYRDSRLMTDEEESSTK